MTFNGPAFNGAVLQVREVATGGILDSVALPGPSWSGAATVGNAVIVGVGSSYTAQPAGVVAITPGGCIRSPRQGTPLRRTVLELDEAFLSATRHV